MKLDRERAALVVVDVQEAFRKAVPDFGEVAAAAGTLAEGATADITVLAPDAPVTVRATSRWPASLAAACTSRT